MGQDIEMLSFENVPDYTGLEPNTASISIKDGETWEGHRYATWVGRIYQNGEVKSAFTKDRESNNTKIFDKLRSDMNLLEKSATIRRDNKMEHAKDFFIPYAVRDHTSTKPTVIDKAVDRASNVHYSVEYEVVLVAGDGFVRYITVPYETEGYWSSSFFDQVENIEDMFDEWFRDGSHDFRDGEDGREVAFYDETGEKLFIGVESVSELLNMIASVRVIKCDRKIID